MQNALVRQNAVANFGVDRLEDHDRQQLSSLSGRVADDLGAPDPPLSASGKAILRNLFWGNSDDIEDANPPFDLVLGSDLMYHSADLLPLADTIAGLTGPRCVTV